MSILNLLSQTVRKPLTEKDAPIKLGVFFFTTIVFFILSLGSNFLSSLGKGNRDMAAVAGIIAILLCCVTAIVWIVYFFVTTWYLYEYTQAGVQQRETNLITKEDFTTSLKKVGKLALVHIIYGIPVGIIGFCIYMFVVLGLVSTLFAGVNSVGSSASTYGDAYLPNFTNMLAVAGGSFLIFCCVVVVFAFLVSLYYHFIVTPATTRMIADNTFNRAFEIGKNWKLMNDNFAVFTKLYILQAAVYVVYIFIVGILSLIPLIGACLILPVMVVFTYYFSLVYPMLMGATYRELKK
jgi:hypothetical protein